MRADTDRFPSGTLKPLADWLHARNFTFGMYTAAGNQTCSTGGRVYPGIDPQPRGVNGSWGHYDQDARTFASWGVDYVKLDWCTKYKNKNELTTKFREALDRTGRDMWLNFHCDGPYQDWCAEDGNSWRIGADHHDVWSSTEGVIENLATVNANNQTGPFRWADPDFLMTGGAGCDTNDTAVRCPGQSENEYRTEMSLWALGAAQILVATDLREMTPFMRGVLLHDEILAIHQDEMGKPGGRIGYSVGYDHDGDSGSDFAAAGSVAAGAGAGAGAGSACAVKLTKQLSTHECAAGTSFGCYNDGHGQATKKMWTSSGCRGVFECDGVAGVLCDPMKTGGGAAHHDCDCVAGPPPPAPGPGPKPKPTPKGKGKPEVWVRNLIGEAVAVGFYNGAGTAQDITCNITEVWQGYGVGVQFGADSANIRDVWGRKDLGLFTGTFTAKAVGVHDTKVFKFTH